MAKLQKDLREFVELLNAANVKYVVVGGYAVAHYGHPRHTGDIDFFVEASHENAERLFDVLQKFGLGNAGVTQQDLEDSDSVVQFGRPPNRIDLVTSIHEVTFAEAWENRVVGELDGLPVPFISLDLLLRNKLASGRRRDLADVEELSPPDQP